MTFIDVDVPASDVFEDDCALRFKAISAAVAITWLVYDAGGGAERLAIHGVDAEGASVPAEAALVEDSSDGTACLIFGGDGGIALVAADGRTIREPYLLLARGTERGV